MMLNNDSSKTPINFIEKQEHHEVNKENSIAPIRILNDSMAESIAENYDQIVKTYTGAGAEKDTIEQKSDLISRTESGASSIAIVKSRLRARNRHTEASNLSNYLKNHDIELKGENSRNFTEQRHGSQIVKSDTHDTTIVGTTRPQTAMASNLNSVLSSSRPGSRSRNDFVSRQSRTPLNVRPNLENRNLLTYEGK